MIRLKLERIENGSTILEIEAAVLRAMEKIQFHPLEINTELSVAKTEGNWMMVFVIEGCSVDELTTLQKELGEKFMVRILGKSKTNLFLVIEAPKEEFLQLKQQTYPEPQRKQYPPTMPTSVSAQQSASRSSMSLNK